MRLDNSTKSRHANNMLYWIIFVVVAVGMTGFLVIFINSSVKRVVSADVVNSTVERSAYDGAVLKTSEGDMEISFYKEQAPQAVSNFISLARSGFYNGVVFHRVIKKSLIQTGDPLTKSAPKVRWGSGGPGYTFDGGATDIPMQRGVVAMASKGSATHGSQFFILTARSAPALKGANTIFARVVDGIEVADAIAGREVDKDNIPKNPPVLERVEVR